MPHRPRSQFFQNGSDNRLGTNHRRVRSNDLVRNEFVSRGAEIARDRRRSRLRHQLKHRFRLLAQNFARSCDLRCRLADEVLSPLRHFGGREDVPVAVRYRGERGRSDFVADIISADPAETCDDDHGEQNRDDTRDGQQDRRDDGTTAVLVVQFRRRGAESFFVRFLVVIVIIVVFGFLLF